MGISNASFPNSRALVNSLLLMLAAATSACELTEVSITEPEPNVVVEAYARISPDGGGSVFALLHGSVGVSDANPNGPEATIRILNESGTEVLLQERTVWDCAYDQGPEPDPRRCYTAVLDAEFVRPSQRLVLEADVVGGGRIEGGTEVPGTFAWSEPAGGDECAVATGELDISWTPSENTWAYLADVMLTGVATDLVALGVVSPSDSAAFDGVTVTTADTSIAFPEDFNVDDDLDYEQLVVDLVEGGMRSDWAADVFVMAIDRNFTNWVRDQVFNPSGTVRIPSLRGAGTGVFGSSVVLTRRIAGSLAGCQ